MCVCHMNSVSTQSAGIMGVCMSHEQCQYSECKCNGCMCHMNSVSTQSAGIMGVCMSHEQCQYPECRYNGGVYVT